MTYDSLMAQLGDEFVVFYSRPWLGQDRFGHEIDGEVDFTVAHADLGILTIEVKGGEISRDGNTGQWTSKDRWGVVHKIKDPVKQARDGKYHLLDKLKREPKWKGRYVRARHGVVLTNSSNPGHPLAPDMPLRIFAFAEEISSLGRWVVSRLEEPEPKEKAEPVGADGIDCLQRLLAASFQLNLKVGGHLAMGQQAIKTLTEEQFHYLDSLAGYKRVLVTGGAGTGKTLLAVRQAQIYAERGQHTLLTCFNNPLGSQFRRHFETEPNIVAGSFHQICASLLGSEAIRSVLNISPNSEDEVWASTIPQMLVDRIAEQNGPFFDAMVIDESQDFRRAWWAALEAILSSGGNAQVRSFMDRNQRVDQRSESISDSNFDIVFPLTRNLRNTQQIFSVAAPFFKSGVTRACGPSGQKVLLDSLPRNASEATERALYHTGRLSRSENVALDDIAVLCSRKADAEAVKQRLAAKKYVVRDAGQQVDPGTICVDTVRRFKGLEAKVVIVHWADAFDDETLLYVAATRAQGLLILIGSDQYLSKIAVGEAVDRTDS